MVSFWGISSHVCYVCTKNLGEDMKMKKLHLYKMYTPQDIAKILLRKEEEIIALLEERRKDGLLGRKIFGFWYVRGKQVIEIQKLLKEKK